MSSKLVAAMESGERQAALVIGAAVALHAIIVHHGMGAEQNLDVHIETAFGVAERFLAEAEKRCP